MLIFVVFIITLFFMWNVVLTNAYEIYRILNAIGHQYGIWEYVEFYCYEIDLFLADE